MNSSCGKQPGIDFGRREIDFGNWKKINFFQFELLIDEKANRANEESKGETRELKMPRASLSLSLSLSLSFFLSM